MKKKEVIKLIEKIMDDKSFCLFCKSMGQILPECPCMTDKECAKHIVELWEKRK